LSVYVLRSDPGRGLWFVVDWEGWLL